MADSPVTALDALVCPVCRGPLAAQDDTFACSACARAFRRNEYGYFDFTLNEALRTFETTTDDYATEQHTNWKRFYDEFIGPWLQREDARRVLEVGCGLGMGVRYAREESVEAFGVDLPCLSPFWRAHHNVSNTFVSGEGAHLPFADAYFDAVYALGVYEHVGTLVGHYTLGPDYVEQRRAFAREMIRVTKPGGRILITCPNRRFPIDIHHEPADAATPPGAMRFRRWFHEQFGMTLHWPMGRYHLLSLGDLRRIFVREAGAQSAEPLPLAHYFGFHKMGAMTLVRPFKRLAIAYIENIPRPLRGTCFDPFLVVEIRR